MVENVINAREINDTKIFVTKLGEKDFEYWKKCPPHYSIRVIAQT